MGFFGNKKTDQLLDVLLADNKVIRSSIELVENTMQQVLNRNRAMLIEIEKTNQSRAFALEALTGWAKRLDMRITELIQPKATIKVTYTLQNSEGIKKEVTVPGAINSEAAQKILFGVVDPMEWKIIETKFEIAAI